MTESDAVTRAAPASPPRRWDWRPKVRWFAAEYLIVVLGVLTAVGINSWWQGRLDVSAEQTYLSLISRDLGQMEADLQELADLEAQRLRRGLTAYRVLSDPVVSDEDQARASVILTQLTSRRTMSPTDATYQDLLSTSGLRLLRNRGLRDGLVAFYEEAERTFDIHNKNNSAFVDDLYARELLGRGLLTGGGGAGTTMRSRPDSLIAAVLPGGYADAPDPLWRLPPNAPEWDVVRAVLLQRIYIAAYAQQFAEEQLEATRALRRSVEAEQL